MFFHWIVQSRNCRGIICNKKAVTCTQIVPDVLSHWGYKKIFDSWCQPNGSRSCTNEIWKQWFMLNLPLLGCFFFSIFTLFVCVFVYLFLWSFICMVHNKCSFCTNWVYLCKILNILSKDNAFHSSMFFLIIA